MTGDAVQKALSSLSMIGGAVKVQEAVGATPLISGRGVNFAAMQNQ